MEEASFLFLLPVGIVLLLLVVIPVLLWRILIVKKVVKPESLVRKTVWGIPSMTNRLGKIALPFVPCYVLAIACKFKTGVHLGEMKAISLMDLITEVQT